MASLHYLTVQDILWINLQVTKKVRHFNYARLEEATFYQYAYGESSTLFPQAARFITGFVKMRPFEAGNEGTALVATLAFLAINGYTTSIAGADVGRWFERVLQKGADAQAAIGEISIPDPEAHHAIVPDVRGAVAKVLESCESVLEALSESAIKTA